MASTRERIGRPTQFHGVSLEERAVDAQGNRLPWALEWADDHPNARHQKRQPEEKGSFGKSTRRRGSSRATRTQTPAKKETLALDGFEAALKFNTQYEPQDQASVVTQGISESAKSVLPSLTKEPMQVILYGYSPDNQWAAIQHYEAVSAGIICEDYDREPPAERRRYQTSLGYSGHIPPRPLTKAERAMAMQYKGGSCWIKVTFDSVEAAERAIFNSPHMIQGHWVYAQPYRGQAHEPDEPILIRDEDRQQGLLGAPKPLPRPQTLGASFAMSALHRTTSATRANATLPRSFGLNGTISEEQHKPAEEASVSSSTASSATALEPTYPDLRHRESSQPNRQVQSAASPTVDSVVSPTFTHFPDTRRTILRPASEAFLPQLSWTEKLFKSLTQSGWIPGDIIGVAVPRLENGDFDWATASFYWKLCYWLDTHLGTDLCGMKEA